MHFRGFPRHTFRLPELKPRYPFLPNEVGNDNHRWAIYADGGTRVVGGEIFAGWVVIS